MRVEIGRLLATAFAALTVASASACGQAVPDAAAGPAASVEAGNPKTACDIVMKARRTALDALVPVSMTLAENKPSADTIAKAAHELEIALTTMHVDVATAAEHTGDPQLKEKILAYQTSVEQAIVAVEGADGEKTELAAVIDSPALRDAEQAVIAACA